MLCILKAKVLIAEIYYTIWINFLDNLLDVCLSGV